jgi:hypothetical protein
VLTFSADVYLNRAAQEAEKISIKSTNNELVGALEGFQNY